LKITDPAYSFLVFQRILITPKDWYSQSHSISFCCVTICSKSRGNSEEAGNISLHELNERERVRDGDEQTWNIAV
jgi:hypothetical protein